MLVSLEDIQLVRVIHIFQKKKKIQFGFDKEVDSTLRFSDISYFWQSIDFIRIHLKIVRRQE